MNALHRAAFQGNLPTVRRILQQQPSGGAAVNVNADDEDGWRALHFAVHRGHLAIVQAILQVEGVHLNVRNIETGSTPLHMACYRPNRLTVILQALLDAGVVPNAAHVDGDMTLYRAAHRSSSHIRVVEALLNGGADPAAQNNNLDTPLHTACQWGQLDIAQLLIQRQGSECLTFKNRREETPLDRLLISSQNRSGVGASIRQHILQAYAGMIAQRNGLLCLHSVLQDVVFTSLADDGNDEVQFELPVGKLSTEHLQMLLEYIIARQPGSVRALDSDGLLPLQAACQLNFPDLVIHELLRPYPGALLLL